MFFNFLADLCHAMTQSGKCLRSMAPTVKVGSVNVSM